MTGGLGGMIGLHQHYSNQIRRTRTVTSLVLKQRLNRKPKTKKEKSVNQISTCWYTGIITDLHMRLKKTVSRTEPDCGELCCAPSCPPGLWSISEFLKGQFEKTAPEPGQQMVSFNQRRCSDCQQQWKINSLIGTHRNIRP